MKRSVKTMRSSLVCFTVTATLCAVFAAYGVELPVLQFRIEGRHTESDEAWERTFGMFKECPDLCDEIWFGTGFGMPTLEKHREFAARVGRASKDVASLGWTPSLMFQATIGHGGPFCEGYDYSGRVWTGWTGSTGVEDRYCSCPRDPRFLEYMREVARIYAANRPVRVWIDDDLRIDNHNSASRGSLVGCWCKRCVADFNAETGGVWTRETLAAAAKNDVTLRVAYEEFSIGSIAAIAKAISEEFHAVSPETKFAIQHGMTATRTINAIVDALHEVAGKPVGYRPGGAAYYDVNPNEQIVKSLSAARCRRDFSRPERISPWTCEIACFPRTYGSRSAQSIIMEGFTGLVFGLDAASALVINYGKEIEDVYLRTRLKPMAEAAPVIRAYAKSCEGTVPVGFASNAPVKKLYVLAQCGIPVLFGPGKTLGTLSSSDIAFDQCKESSAAVQKFRDSLDARAGDASAVLESPFVGLMMPRVSANGELRNVALLGLRIEEQGPVRLRLRGVPEGATSAVWREIRREPQALAIIRGDGVCCVEVPSVGAWNGGYIEF